MRRRERGVVGKLGVGIEEARTEQGLGSDVVSYAALVTEWNLGMP